MQPEDLDRVMEGVLAKPDYQQICKDLVRWIAQQEMGKRRNLKEVIKFTRSRLHQVATAYQATQMDYQRWSDELVDLPHELKHPLVMEFCKRVMNSHASSRERLSILDTFFEQTMNRIAPVHSILDVGCGMNVLALPWMPIAGDLIYYGLDIYYDQAEFLNNFLEYMGISGSIQVCNVIGGLPDTIQHTQVTLILKTLPCLEQLDKNVSKKLIESLDSNYLIVSYPVHSLGGHSKGMLQNYQNHFDLLAGQSGWTAQRVEFNTELAFIVEL